MRDKTCKICGEKFIPNNSLQKVCRNYKCMVTHLKLTKKIKHEKLKSFVQCTVKYWRAKAWTEISKSIRYSDLTEIDGELKGQCFTCGNWKIPQRLHAGHFRHRKLDDDPMNVHKQCERCNKHLHGNLENYYLELLIEHGEEKVGDLILRAESEQPKTWVEWKEVYLKFKAQNEIKNRNFKRPTIPSQYT